MPGHYGGGMDNKPKKGLTEKQKKNLPKQLQAAILAKQKSNGKKNKKM
jgi:hypothetical protein